MSNNIIELEKVVVKFAGDSGDGMQLTGTQFTETSALFGNDVATFPDFPAEIRAPQGTVAGVSGFQVHIGKIEINTPGDAADVLIAMNPAALKANIDFLEKGKTIIIDIDTFKAKDLEKAHFKSNPLEDGTLDDFKVIEAPISSMTRECLKDMGMDNKSMMRCKNMFALGIVYWMFSRPLDNTLNFLNMKFKNKPQIIEANTKTLKAGYHFAETIEALPSAYSVLPAELEKGTYRSITGNQATAWGFLAAAENSQKKLFLGSYPITPASDVLHELSKHKHFGVTAFQAEDEIASVAAAIGASYAGNLAITTTSGPGLALKAEAIGLAVMTELPIVVVDVQRGGPSTGLPTKTEQSDLMQALHGRNGESPTILIASSTPSNCFDFAYMACKLAMEHLTPVILLSDGYIANGSEPWKIKSLEDMPAITPNMATPETKDWQPYARDKKRLAREWAIPGMKGLEHRIGGLEKEDITGDVCYLPLNHQKMCEIRQEKVDLVANYIPDQKIFGEKEGDLLIIGWGGTYGHLYSSVKKMRSEGNKVSLAHFNYINPLPKNTADIFKDFKKILVCELNFGQFANHLRTKFPEYTFEKYNKVQGFPFTTNELMEVFKSNL
jgi:2-oxoglutarate ferredoxin oxidoreductase subunit alpha